MTRFPRQLAVAVVVLFAFTFLSGCRYNKEDDEEQTNSNQSQANTQNTNQGTQAQPDKKTCTVEIIEIKGDGSGGKLTTKKCKNKGEKLEVGEKCEFECTGSKEDHKKKGEIKCLKNGKIDNTAECNQSDARRKALKEDEYKNKIVELLFKSLRHGSQKKKVVEVFVDEQANEWPTSNKEKFEELKGKKELKKFVKEFVNWEIARKKATAKKSIKTILKKKLPKEYKAHVERYVDETIHNPVPAENRLKDKDQAEVTVAVTEHKKNIDKLLDIDLLSGKMVEFLGDGIEDDEKGKIEAYLDKSRQRAKAKRFKAADAAGKEVVVNELVKGYCIQQMTVGMKKSESGARDSLETDFANYFESKDDVRSLTGMYHQVMADKRTHKYLQKYASEQIQDLLDKEELEPWIEEHCYNDFRHVTMINLIRDAADTATRLRAFQGTATSIAKDFVKEGIKEQLPHCHSTVIANAFDVYWNAAVPPLVGQNEDAQLNEAKRKMNVPDKGTPFARHYVKTRDRPAGLHGRHHAAFETWVEGRTINNLRAILRTPHTQHTEVLQEISAYGKDHITKLVKDELARIAAAAQAGQQLNPARRITKNAVQCNNWIAGRSAADILNCLNLANDQLILARVEQHA